MTVGTAYGFFRSSMSCPYIGKELRAIRKGTLSGMKLETDPNIPKELRLSMCASWHLSNGMGTTAFLFDEASGSYRETDVSDLRGDRKLAAIAQEWRAKGANYFIRAEIPDATNEKAADELGYIMKILHAGCIIVGKTGDDSNPISEIFRERDGAYVSARLESPGAG